MQQRAPAAGQAVHRRNTCYIHRPQMWFRPCRQQLLHVPPLILVQTTCSLDGSRETGEHAPGSMVCCLITTHPLVAISCQGAELSRTRRQLGAVSGMQN